MARPEAIATWHLIQYMADPRRREPRNVGIALDTPDGWFLRFVGEDTQGRISGQKIRSHHLKKDVYETWVRYYRRKAAESSWQDVEKLHASKPSNFTSAVAGQLFETEADWLATLSSLFTTLVEEEKQATPAEIFREKIERVFEIAQIVPSRDIEVPGRWADQAEEVPIPFDFGYQNGQYHVMDGVSVSRRQSITDFKARMDAVIRSHEVNSCIAFYEESAADSEHLEAILRPLEVGAITIPVDDEIAAAESLSDIMAH